MVLIYAAGHSCASYALTLIKAAQSLCSRDWKGLILSLTSQGAFLQKGDPVDPGDGGVCGAT